MSRNLATKSTPLTNVENLLGNAARLVGTNLYIEFIHFRPSTVAIYNVFVD